jgi:hypothetical protein
MELNIIGIVASIATFALFTSLSKRYLPKDAFTKWPDAAVFGFQVSYPLGRAVPLKNPFTLGLRLGLSFLAGIAGADAVVSYTAPDRAWLYSYWGDLQD